MCERYSGNVRNERYPQGLSPSFFHLRVPRQYLESTGRANGNHPGTFCPSFLSTKHDRLFESSASKCIPEQLTDLIYSVYTRVRKSLFCILILFLYYFISYITLFYITYIASFLYYVIVQSLFLRYRVILFLYYHVFFLIF